VQNLVSTAQKVNYLFILFRFTNMKELVSLLLNGFYKINIKKCIGFSMIDVVA